MFVAAARVAVMRLTRDAEPVCCETLCDKAKRTAGVAQVWLYGRSPREEAAREVGPRPPRRSAE